MTIPFFVFKEILINMNNCGCNRIITPDCDMKRWEVECSSYIVDADNYYTKKEVDDLIEGASGCCITPEEVDEKIEAATSGLQETLVAGDNIIISGNVISAEVPSLSGYATEEWVNEQGYLKTVEPLKTINGETLIGEGNIVITGSSVTVDDHLDGTSTNPVQNKVIVGALNDKLDASAYTPTDLSNYYTTAQTVNLVESAVTIVEAEIPSLSGYATEQWVLDKHYITGVDLSNYATQNWVLSQNYVTYTEFIQYIANLQNQIDALRAQISGCCADTGTTLTRWITMTGASDYTCSGTTKMTKEEEEQSTDGGNTWVSTGNYRTGSTVIELNSIDCGYTPSNPKLYATYNTSETLTIQCDGQPLGQLEPQHGGSPYIGNMLTVEIGGCAVEIDNDTFGTIATNLRSVVINEGVEYISQSAFQNLSNLSAVTIPNSVTGISYYAFEDCTNLTNCTIGSGVTNIQGNAFDNCRSMSGSVDLPNVTTIGSGAFKNCKNLTSINIGSGITSIGGYMVDGCSGLTGITINAVTPPSINWFTFDNSTCPIYVPSASVNAYKTGHSNWQHYADRIQPIA